MSANPVPRIGRALDLVGAVIFVAGAALYARSWLGLRAMDTFVRADGAPAFAAVERADQLARLGRVGLAVMATGVAVAVIAAIVARRLRSRPA